MPFKYAVSCLKYYFIFFIYVLTIHSQAQDSLKNLSEYSLPITEDSCSNLFPGFAPSPIRMNTIPILLKKTTIKYKTSNASNEMKLNN